MWGLSPKGEHFHGFTGISQSQYCFSVTVRNNVAVGLQVGPRKIVRGRGFRGANVGNRPSAR